MNFPLVALSIFGVNLALSGDNAVLIASALAAAPKAGRGRALLIAGTLAALVLVVATVFASRWLRLPWLQLAGGVFVPWVAVNLLRGGPGADLRRPPRGDVRALIGAVLAAEVTMSVDNVFAVAAIARGDAAAVALGLGPSVVLVVCASRFLAWILERYPALTLAVGAVLGGVAAEMITTDPMVEAFWNVGPLMREGVRIAAALCLVTYGGLVWLRGRAVRR